MPLVVNVHKETTKWYKKLLDLNGIGDPLVFGLGERKYERKNYQHWKCSVR